MLSGFPALHRAIACISAGDTEYGACGTIDGRSHAIGVRSAICPDAAATAASGSATENPISSRKTAADSSLSSSGS